VLDENCMDLFVIKPVKSVQVCYKIAIEFTPLNIFYCEGRDRFFIRGLLRPFIRSREAPAGADLRVGLSGGQSRVHR
jgi:hypothetical protein